MLPVGPRGLEPAECVFNRGVFVMDVRRWKKLQITREIERWMARYRESKKDPGWRRNLFWTIHSRNELDHWKATAQESYLRASGIPVTRLVSFRTYTSSGSLSPRGFLLCTTDTAISALVLDERTGRKFLRLYNLTCSGETWNCRGLGRETLSQKETQSFSVQNSLADRADSDKLNLGLFKSQELKELKADLKMDFKALQKAGVLGVVTVVTCSTGNNPEAGLRPSGDQVRPYLALGTQSFVGMCFARMSVAQRSGSIASCSSKVLLSRCQAAAFQRKVKTVAG